MTSDRSSGSKAAWNNGLLKAKAWQGETKIKMVCNAKLNVVKLSFVLHGDNIANTRKLKEELDALKASGDWMDLMCGDEPADWALLMTREEAEANLHKQYGF